MARYARRPASAALRPQGPWKHGASAVIGLVGGMGAGKSLAASRLAELGAQVIDADAVGHALLDQAPARNAVRKRFGEHVLAAGEAGGKAPLVDRRVLGALVFAKPEALRDLEAILHPRMKRTFERVIDRAARRGEPRAVVLDAAVLFEAGWNELCDIVVFIDAPRAERLARLAAQRGWSAETVAARERVQMPLDEKRRRSDLVLINQADPEALRAAVDAFWQTKIAAKRRPGAADSPRAARRRSVPAPRRGPP